MWVIRSPEELGGRLAEVKMSHAVASRSQHCTAGASQGWARAQGSSGRLAVVVLGAGVLVLGLVEREVGRCLAALAASPRRRMAPSLLLSVLAASSQLSSGLLLLCSRLHPHPLPCLPACLHLATRSRA